MVRHAALIEHFHTFTDPCPAAHILVTEEGEIVAVNIAAQKLSGLERDTCNGKKLSDFVSDRPDDLLQYLHVCARNRRPMPGAISWRQTGNGPHEYRCQGFVIEPHSSDSTALVIIHCETKDVAGNKFIALNRKMEELEAAYHKLASHAEVLKSEIARRMQVEEEQRALEKQMHHVQKLESLGIMAGGIAHDFNNMLMAVLGNADLALADLEPWSPVRPFIEEIEKVSRRAADLCRQMLAYSGRGKFVVKTVNLSDLLLDMAGMLEISVSKKAVLKFNCPENLPPIDSDPSQLRQIIMNLVINASEAIGNRSGVITVSTGAVECDRAYLAATFLDENLAEGLYTYLEVADTGHGMDRETKAKLFDPFFTTKFTGRGLGMSAVLGIVRGHKGGIKVYSEPGRGTAIKLLFPAVPDALPGDMHEGPAGDGKWQGKGTVLLVDDDETVRAVGRQMLERLGFNVLTANDGSQGVAAYREHTAEIDLVLLDLTMPHMDGEETFREMRRISAEVRVILSSGYNEQDVTQRFAGKGLAGFIQKPYTLEPLRDTIQKAFEKTSRPPG